VLPVEGRLPRRWAAAVGYVIVLACALSGPWRIASAQPPPVAAAPPLGRWHIVEQPGVVVVSDAGASVTAEVASRVRALQDVFASVWPPASQSPRPVIVIAVRSGATLQTWLAAAPVGARHPPSAGLFVRGLDRDYLAIALDADRTRPYGALDHEYGHLLVDRHCGRLPVWLDEGLAEAIANGLPGRATEDRTTLVSQALRLERLMPLRRLLTAERGGADGAALFHAQAWTLVHYLLVADSGARAPRLAVFMTQLMQGVADLDAATHAFGDLAAVEAAWTRYVRTGAFAYIRAGLPRLGTGRIAAHRADDSETRLLIGDFLAHGGSTAVAAAMLTVARTNATRDRAAERLALAHLVARDFARAEQAADDAIRGERRVPIAHYVRAVAVMAQSSALPLPLLARTEQDLRLSIESHPHLARAYAVLGGLLAVARGRASDGLALVRQAIVLDPSDFANRIALAQVLLLDGQHDEARWLATHIVRRAAVDEERAIGERLLLLAGQAAPKRAQTPEPR
jgi:tetratricopeptide (TPR) repeat protein